MLGLLSDRLVNAELTAPDDVNGFAPPWRASSDFLRTCRADIDPSAP